MIKVGDRVKFISDTAVGVVSSVKGAIANVVVEDGFEIPAMINDLVVVATQDEADAIKRMGIGDGNPVGKPGNKHSNQPRTEKKRPPQRSVNHYGKISLSDEFEDEDPIDMSYIKQNMLKNRAAENDAHIKKEEAVKKAAPSPIEDKDYDIKLCFVPEIPVRPEESNLKLYLVNDSSYSVFYTISRWNGDRYVTNSANGKMEADSQQDFFVFKRSELSVAQRLLINIMLFKPTSYVPQPMESVTIELSPMKFVRRGSYTENDYFDEPSIIFTVASSKVEKPLEISATAIEQALKEKGDIKREQPKTDNKPINEPEIIDLHAEEILDSTEGLSAGEILKAQLSRFEIALDLGISNNKGGKIVFIHGVGSGKLKYEIEKLMKTKYLKLRFQDASFKEYGYGAIMVFLK